MLILFLLLVSHALHINFSCTFMVGCIVVLTAMWYGIRFCWSHTVANHTYSSLIKMILILSVRNVLLGGRKERKKEGNIRKDQKNIKIRKNGQYYPIISYFKSLILLKIIQWKLLSFSTFLFEFNSFCSRETLDGKVWTAETRKSN